MKYVKKFEEQEQKVYILNLTELTESETETWMFLTKEDLNNYILNYVNGDISDIYQEEEQDDKILITPSEYGSYNDENGIPTFTNPDEALEWFNDNSADLDGGQYNKWQLDSDVVLLIQNVELNDRIKKVIDLKKYNL